MKCGRTRSEFVGSLVRQTIGFVAMVDSGRGEFDDGRARVGDGLVVHRPAGKVNRAEFQ